MGKIAVNVREHLMETYAALSAAWIKTQEFYDAHLDKAVYFCLKPKRNMPVLLSAWMNVPNI